LLHVAQNELALFTQIQGAGAPALVSLWRAWGGAANEPNLTEILQLQDGELHISAHTRLILDRRRQQKKQEPSALSFGSKARLECRVHIPRSALEPCISIPNAPMAERPLEAVLRMAYDHEQDLGTAPAGDEVVPVGWRGVELCFKEGPPLYLWPVPAWPTLFEWEVLEQSWQEAERLALGARGMSMGPPSPRILDGLAYWLLFVCEGLQGRSEVSQRFKLEPSVSDWRELLMGHWRPRFRNQEVRPHLYKPWRRLLPLLATPEAGLSETAATIILGLILRQRSELKDIWSSFLELLGQQKKTGVEIMAALKDVSGNSEEWTRETKQLTPSFLKAHRKSRTIEAGVPKESVDKFLADIDSTFPNHPWVKVFGPWGRAPRHSSD
jgi:hypothetical protein